MPNRTTKVTNLTPLMAQHQTIKKKYPDAILLFRVGDFYETFGQDAVATSKVLDIVLTQRSNGKANAVPLAGFPYHALDNYLPKLVRAGYRVAVCDQLEHATQSKGLVKRGVTELITPGLTYHDEVLPTRQPNYLASLYQGKKQTGIALLDISTGEFCTTEGDLAAMVRLVLKFNPAEIICSEKNKKHFSAALKTNYHYHALPDWVYQRDYAREQLTKHFGTKHLQGFGIADLNQGIIASGAILHYLEATHHTHNQHINTITRLVTSAYMWMDAFTIASLELCKSQQAGGVSLLDILDHTITPMGARCLRRWLLSPLKEVSAIEKRQNMVAMLHDNSSLASALRQHVSQLGDFERLITKVATRRANPRQLQALQHALTQIPTIQNLLSAQSSCLQAQAMAKQLHACEAPCDLLQQTLVEEAPLYMHQGPVIRKGVNPTLDRLRGLAQEGKAHLQTIQRAAIAATGITSLKIGYNKVYGYYLEVTHAHRNKVPQDWIRKQTLTNAERYITPALKDFETQILQAESQGKALEQQLYHDLLDKIVPYIPMMQKNAGQLASLDVYLSFAYSATRYRYTRPKLNDTCVLDIQQGCHPVIATQLPPGQAYVPNNLYLNPDTQQIKLITGPNMAGKSAYLRQTALIVLMAQIGSFVPAAQATLGIVDKLFTRVGASDNLAKGESTFMVEMMETACILNSLTPRSLILMDEIGRGTGTYDGLSLAEAILRYLHEVPTKPRTLFATHYHALNRLADSLTRLHNYSVKVKEVANQVLFLYKVEPGGASHSFGIHVAQMAGIPASIIQKAKAIMHRLAQNKPQILNQLSPNTQSTKIPTAWAKIKKTLNALQLDKMTPLEGLTQLHALQRMANAST